MAVWSKSEMETFHADGSYTIDCDVRIDGDQIVVSYFDNGSVEYRGREVAEGHFTLACPSLNGRATLHRLPNSEYLDGFWTEGGERGMWRVSLDDGRAD